MAKRRASDALSLAWRDVWESPSGRIAISELLVAANVYSEITTSDPTLLAIAVGERNMGARVARFIGLKPENYASDAAQITDRVGRFIESNSEDLY